MLVRDLIQKLQHEDEDVEVVICVREEDGELRAYDLDMVGHDGWDMVYEIHLGELISG